MANIRLSDELLTAALSGYESQLESVETKILELRRMLGDRPTDGAVPTENGTPRRKFSVATRRKMAASQRARYARKAKTAAAPEQSAAASA